MERSASGSPFHCGSASLPTRDVHAGQPTSESRVTLCRAWRDFPRSSDALAFPRDARSSPDKGTRFRQRPDLDMIVFPSKAGPSLDQRPRETRWHVGRRRGHRPGRRRRGGGHLGRSDKHGNQDLIAFTGRKSGWYRNGGGSSVNGTRGHPVRTVSSSLSSAFPRDRTAVPPLRVHAGWAPTPKSNG